MRLAEPAGENGIMETGSSVRASDGHILMQSGDTKASGYPVILRERVTISVPNMNAQ